MRLFRYSILLFLIMFYSCGNLKQLIKKNHKKTSTFFEELSKKNGNAFSVRSNYINTSYVWTYKKKLIIIYKIQNGKILNKQTEVKGDLDWLNASYKDSEMYSDCFELDGDLISYKTLLNGEYISDDIPVNIDCFISKDYKNDFYFNIANDISTYNFLDNLIKNQ